LGVIFAVGLSFFDVRAQSWRRKNLARNIREFSARGKNSSTFVPTQTPKSFACHEREREIYGEGERRAPLLSAGRNKEVEPPSLSPTFSPRTDPTCSASPCSPALCRRSKAVASCTTDLYFPKKIPVIRSIRRAHAQPTE